LQELHQVTEINGHIVQTKSRRAGVYENISQAHAKTLTREGVHEPSAKRENYCAIR